MPTDPRTATAPSTHVASPIAVMLTEAAMRPWAFNDYCKAWGPGYYRGSFWQYIRRHGYTPLTVYPAWRWESWWAEFEHADLRDTQHDALV